MSAVGFHGRHLTSEEIVARVFPVHEGGLPVPLHLSVCPECQEKVGRLRESWLLDKGAVAGVLEEIPPGFWEEQRSSILSRVQDEAGKSIGLAPFPLRWTARAVRRPAVAAACLAAALALVAGISTFWPHGARVAPASSTAMATATAPRSAASTDLVNAADVRDDELLRGVDQSLSEDVSFRPLIPEEV